MLKQKDLEAAVAAGIISEDQADELNDFALKRRQLRNFAAGRDERFKLLGGMNDFFVAIGVALLVCGMWFGASSFKEPTAYLIGIFVLWGLAEVLTARLRLTAPSIVISIFLSLFAFLAANGLMPAQFGNPVLTPSIAATLVPTIAASLAALAIAVLHYLRFRLPFSIAVIAVTLLISIISVTSYSLDSKVAGLNLIIVFVYGLFLFAFAMWFDSSDRERLTRRADTGFWLHLAAAPMIVHPLVKILTTQGTNANGQAALIIVAIALLLAITALIVDRRALVVVSLSYLGGAIAYGVAQLSGSSESSTNATFTLLFLGAIIVALGVGWHDIRRRVMAVLPDGPYKSYLPPTKETS